MKMLLLAFPVFALFLGADRSVCAQGTIMFNNLGANTGRVYVYPGEPSPVYALLNQDLNFSLIVHLPGLVSETARSWLLSDGTAKGINVGPGLFADPTHSVIVVPGMAPGQNIVVSVGAWTGNYPTVRAARAAGAPFGESQNFVVVAGTIEEPPASLVSMPEFGVRAIPEPGFSSLATIGLALLFLNRMR